MAEDGERRTWAPERRITDGPPEPDMDSAALKQTLAENAHVALEHTDKGARMRRRVVAVGGFGLFVLGFLAAVGLGRLILVALLVTVGIGLTLVVLRQVRRRNVLAGAAGAVSAS